MLDKSTDTRGRLIEATDFELTIKLGKLLLHAETRRLINIICKFISTTQTHYFVYFKWALPSCPDHIVVPTLIVDV